MLSETLKQKKSQEIESFQTILKGASRKRIPRKPKNYHTEITAHTLNLQLAKKRDTSFCDLTFKDCFDNDEKIKKLEKVLKSVKKMRRVGIWFSRKRKFWNVQAIPQLLKDLPFVQVISVGFPKTSEITNKTLDHIGRCLKRLKVLKEIELDFYFCCKMADTGLQNLAKGVKRCPLLENIKVNFWWCEKITSAGLNSLSKSFKRLTSLDRVSFYFNYCQGIADKELQGLAVNLKGLGRLQHINLLMIDCQEITGEGLCSFCETIKKSSSLQRIKISYSGWTRISSIEEQKIIEIFTEHFQVREKWPSFVFDKKKKE